MKPLLLLVACRALRPQYDFTYSTAAGRRAVAEDAMRSRARRLGRAAEPGPRIAPRRVGTLTAK